MNKIKKIQIKRKLLFYNSNQYIRDLRNAGLEIGDNCTIYNPQNTKINLSSLDFIKIGNYVQITDGVLILGHDYSYSVIANITNEILRPQYETIIGDNVFIGMNSIILCGSKIGNNVIIGAGSVVHGYLESNNVYAGNPAKKICSINEYRDKIYDRFISSAQIYCKKRKINQNNIYYCLIKNNSSEINELVRMGRYAGVNKCLNVKLYPSVFKTITDLREWKK